MEFYDFNARRRSGSVISILQQYSMTQIQVSTLPMKDGEAFDVVCIISGTVTRVEEDATWECHRNRT